MLTHAKLVKSLKSSSINTISIMIGDGWTLSITKTPIEGEIINDARVVRAIQTAGCILRGEE